ncbi:MAG: phosphoribosylamine--glycine ligase [Bacteroidetes bacterium]|nr:MAG: phosphoribosylamine--glycine ligase [Bacteroidota bacterium]TAF95429.1 MAG: phosphoribosylamine--glycine ligase [Bacteroidota bacterium]
MHILILGSGGREHALAQKISESPHCTKLFIAPGNAGTALLGTNVNLSVSNFSEIGHYCTAQNIGMVVVGPEEPLVLGIVDYFANEPALRHIQVVGPTAKGAQLEGSKAFSKHFMQRHGIPTAAYAEFTEANYEEAVAYVKNHALPIVLKADGLAAGKGVVIAATHDDALTTLHEMLVKQQFGKASAKVVIEEFLSGVEVSVFALTDGRNYQIIGHAKDYKRIGEGDTGLNTGGMGCVSPVPFVDAAFMQVVEDTIVRPTIAGLEQEQITYQGFVFFGLINCHGKPFVIEYNCRMGDPETEVVLPRLENDLVQLFQALKNGDLHQQTIRTRPLCTATIVGVSGGYPGTYAKGIPVHLGAQQIPQNGYLYHAGTTVNDDGQLVTNGGRVFAATGTAPTLEAAVAIAQETLNTVHFEGMYYRTDIGYEFIKRH